MMTLLALLLQPELDFKWIEDRAQLRGAWERCVHTQVVRAVPETGELVETQVARAMLICGQQRRAYEARVRSTVRDPKEVAIQIAGTTSEIRRRAIRWVRLKAQ